MRGILHTDLSVGFKGEVHPALRMINAAVKLFRRIFYDVSQGSSPYGARCYLSRETRLMTCNGKILAAEISCTCSAFLRRVQSDLCYVGFANLFVPEIRYLPFIKSTSNA